MANDIFQFPELPRLCLGPYTFLPLVDRLNDPAHGKWVLPGCQVITTQRAMQIARERNLHLNIIEGRKQ